MDDGGYNGVRSLALLAAALPATAATEADVKAHVAAAERAAGDDLKAFFRLCQPASVTRPTVGDDALAKLIATPGPGLQRPSTTSTTSAAAGSAPGC
ncbi:MAG: hypothetical protein U1F25_06340 [Rubrivivax sp.]